MGKTIFGRILLTNLCVILLCILLISSLLFAFFTNHLIGEQKATLQKEAMHVGELTVFFQDNVSPAIQSFYSMSIGEIAQRIRGVVLIVDREGEILASSKNVQEHISGTFPTGLLDRIFAGEYTQLGNPDGFFRGTYLLVSRPIEYHGTVPAVSCVAVPMPRINQYRNDLFGLILLAVFMTTLLACVVSYFLSRRISRPLKHISLAARSIAKGDFSVVVPVRGENELADLSETFNQMTYSLKQLDDMRNGFIASVSHELRTPMTTIAGFVEGILDHTIPAGEQEKYLAVVLEETKRLSRLVNELLLVARMEGGLQLNCSTFDMNEAVRVAILRFESAFTEKNISADISFDSEVCPVFADRDGIDRVLINLFDNALKFNRDGGYVRVQVRSTEQGCTVTVENSGIGIGAEDIQRIWDKFYKTDRSRGQDKTGVGLGLYLVKNIITAHGGKIHVESEPEKFTRFTFTLKKN